MTKQHGTTIYGRITAHDGGTPVHEATITDTEGFEHHVTVSRGETVGYGLGNEENREYTRAWQLTASGRLRKEDMYLTATYRTLAQYFPQGAHVQTLVTRDGPKGLYAVHAFTVRGSKIYNLSGLVAGLLSLPRAGEGVHMKNIQPGPMPVVDVARTLVDRLGRTLYGAEHGLVNDPVI